MKIKAILFDLDGTLIDLKFKFQESRIAIIEFLKLQGINSSTFSLIDDAQTIVDKVEDYIRTKSLTHEFAEIKKQIWSIIDDYEMESVNNSVLLADVPSSINQLKKKVKLGIVTNNGRKATNVVLLKHGLADLFETIVTRDDVDKLKPHGEGIKLALKKIDADNRDAIFIGDSVNDVLAARDAGTHSIIINRFIQNEKIQQIRPDYIIRNLKDVQKFIE